MRTKIILLNFVLALPAIAQIGPNMANQPQKITDNSWGTVIDIPEEPKEVIKCRKIVDSLKSEHDLRGEKYDACHNTTYASSIIAAKSELSDCVGNLLKYTDVKYELIDRCLDSKLRVALEDKDNFTNCLKITKNIGLSFDNLRTCSDSTTMSMIKNPAYVKCVERRKLLDPGGQVSTHLNNCRLKAQMDAMNSPDIEKCEEAMVEMGAKEGPAIKYCLNSQNQKGEALAILKSCQTNMKNLVGSEFALNYCLEPRAAKVHAQEEISCLQKSLNVLDSNYIKDEKSHNLLVNLVGGFAFDCMNTKSLSIPGPVSVPQNSNSSALSLIGVKYFSHNADEGKLGGLSGLSYNQETGTLFAVSDDTGIQRTNTRYYEFKLDVENGLNLDMVESHNLHTYTSKVFRQSYNIDAEGIAMMKGGFTVVSSETLLHNSNSFVKIYNSDNNQVGEVEFTDKFLPKWADIEKEEIITVQSGGSGAYYGGYPSLSNSGFNHGNGGGNVNFDVIDERPIKGPTINPLNESDPQNTHAPSITIGNSSQEKKPITLKRKWTERQQVNGIFQNRGFEALTATYSGSRIYTANEYPLIQDNMDHKKIVRIIQLGYVAEAKTFQTSSEYAYELEPTQDNGLVDLAILSDKKLLSLERRYDYATNKVTSAIFEVDLTNAHNYMDIESLLSEDSKNPIKTVKKKLLLNLEDLIPSLPRGLNRIDNIEGIAIGPKLKNGNSTILLVSDNNFNSRQMTQFILLEMTK